MTSAAGAGAGRAGSTPDIRSAYVNSWILSLVPAPCPTRVAVLHSGCGIPQISLIGGALGRSRRGRPPTAPRARCSDGCGPGPDEVGQPGAMQRGIAVQDGVGLG